MEQKNEFMVTYDKEAKDAQILIDRIKDSNWLKKDTVFVNCFPEYSSRLAHLLSHKLSYLNANEPFEVLNLGMPYANMVQVWDYDEVMYKMFIKYLADWTRKYLKLSERFLFIGAEVYEPSFSKIRSTIKGKVDNEDYRFATLYKSKNVAFLPDYYTQEYEGRLLFQWENSNNPNK